MKPLIKWPGGKSSEIRQFEYLIPDYDRYIEPFAGGAALFFHLEPACAVIGDTSQALMEFYQMVKEQDPRFHRILDLYCRSFSALKEACERNYGAIRDLYRLYQAGLEEKIDLPRLGIHETLVKKVVSDQEISGELVADREEYLARLCESVQDKMIRTARGEQRKTYSDRDRKNNLVTGFTAGFYLYFRDVFNQIADGRLLCSPQYRCANFYFIREYCYGSMFRYNAGGAFNIPYGGVSYNRKDLSGKVARLFSPECAALMRRTQLRCGDFETILSELNVNERDFLFLDPPYDTEFSDYEGHAFGREDQKRLSDLLLKTKAQFLLVIKDTPYIRSLYEGHFRMLTFENRYLYNVRSRNNREALHLIITNIPEGMVPWIRTNIPAQAEDFPR